MFSTINVHVILKVTIKFADLWLEKPDMFAPINFRELIHLQNEPIKI